MKLPEMVSALVMWDGQVLMEIIAIYVSQVILGME